MAVVGGNLSISPTAAALNLAQTAAGSCQGRVPAVELASGVELGVGGQVVPGNVGNPPHYHKTACKLQLLSVQVSLLYVTKCCNKHHILVD